MRRCECRKRDIEGGYVLIELMLALLLIAMLASLALPGFARGTGPAALRVTAFEIAALLREDRNLAIESRHPVTTLTDRSLVQSGGSAGRIAMPAGVELSGESDMLFMPDGHARGGDLTLTSSRARMIVAVNSDTGAIRVIAP